MQWNKYFIKFNASMIYYTQNIVIICCQTNEILRYLCPKLLSLPTLFIKYVQLIMTGVFLVFVNLFL